MAKQNITFSTRFTDFKPINPEFTLAKCWVCALGENANGSYISKEAADAALPSLWNIPVIGHLYIDENGECRMGGHDRNLQRNEKGELVFKALTVPFGVVPYMPDEMTYEDVVEPDGSTKTYITCPVILWSGRYPEVMESINKDEMAWSQSMEITVDEAEPFAMNPEYLDLRVYNYSALCLLGRYDDEYNVEPCFPEAKVVVSNFSLEDDKFVELFSQLKQELKSCFNSEQLDDNASYQVEDKVSNNLTSEEGNNDMKDDVVLSEEQTNIEPESSSTEVKSLNEIEVTETEISVAPTEEMELEAIDPQPENADSSEDNEVAEKNSHYMELKSNFTSANEKYHALEKLYVNQVNTDDIGLIINEIEYDVFDYTDEYVYVIAHIYDYSNDELIYTKRHFRQAYVYDAENDVATLTGPEEDCEIVWLTIEEMETIKQMRSEYDSLVKFKADKELEEQHQALDKVVEQFDEDLSGMPEYDEISANRYSYASVEALQNACYIIKGKYGIFSREKSNQNYEPVIPIDGSSKVPMTAREKLHAEFGKN